MSRPILAIRYAHEADCSHDLPSVAAVIADRRRVRRWRPEPDGRRQPAGPGDHDRRIEHGVPGHRGGGRGVPEGQSGHARHRRHLGHRRRLQKFCRDEIDICRRLTADQAAETRGVRQGRHRVRRAARRLRRPGRRREPEEHLGDVDDRRRAEEDSGSRPRRARSRAGARSAPAGRTGRSTCSAPGVDSGTFDYFTEAINGKEDASRGDYTSSEDDNVIVQGVSGDENALGYFGYRLLRARTRTSSSSSPIDDGDDGNGAGRDRARRPRPWATAPTGRCRGRSSSIAKVEGARAARGARASSSST